jgi:hypothetical protein
MIEYKSARQSILLMVLMSIGSTSFAAGLMDYIRNYDLNDYALGLTLSGSQNPYAGGENSAIGYPVLTSFRDSAFTKDWLLLREGEGWSAACRHWDSEPLIRRA